MSLDRLETIMRRLRDPATGCEWDRVQTFATIAPYTIEEAYEVADAIERGNMADLADEGYLSQPHTSPALAAVVAVGGR